MTTKFLGSTQNGSLTDGSTNIVGATLSGANLIPSFPLKTSASSILVSTKLEISDINQLQIELDAISAGWVRNAPLVALLNAGDKVAVDVYRSANGVDDMVFENTMDAQDNIKTDQISESTGGVSITMNHKTIHSLGIRDSTLTASKLLESDGGKNLVSVTDLSGHFSGGTQISITGTDPLTFNSDNTQNMNVGDAPTFTGATFSGLTASKLVETTAGKALASVTDLTGHFSGGTNISITGTDPLTINNDNTQALNTGDDVTFLSATHSSLTASSLIQTDGLKKLISTDLATIATGGTQISITGNTINSDNTQNMNTGDSPSFTGVTVSGLTASKLVETTAGSALASVTDLTGHFTGGTQISITGTDPLTFNSDNTQDLNIGDSPTFTGVLADTLDEKTLNAGVTVEGVLLKDSEITLGVGTNVSEFSIDGLLAGDSDDAVPTEQAVKTYVDSFNTVENAASEGNSTTTGLAFVEKVSLSFTAVASDYLVSWYAEVNSTDSGTRVEVQIEEDDTTVLAFTDWNPDDSDLVGYGPMSGFAIVTLGAGTVDFDMDFSSSQDGKTVQIRRARITAKRIL